MGPLSEKYTHSSIDVRLCKQALIEPLQRNVTMATGIIIPRLPLNVWATQRIMICTDNERRQSMFYIMQTIETHRISELIPLILLCYRHR